jgi:hypothetical protein
MIICLAAFAPHQRQSALRNPFAEFSQVQAGNEVNWVETTLELSGIDVAFSELFATRPKWFPGSAPP